MKYINWSSRFDENTNFKEETYDIMWLFPTTGAGNSFNDFFECLKKTARATIDLIPWH